MKTNNIYKLILAIAICQLAGIIGALFTSPAIKTWYSTLVLPVLNPPSWIFGPVWTLLYLLMGIAAYLVWQQGKKKRSIPIKVFALQLFLNSIWSILFFGLQKPGLALIDILTLLISIVWTMVLFFKISKPAAYLLVPYILWVSFATYLNYSIWILN